MYWWNVSKLVEDLREGRVEEKERFKYYMAYAVLYSVVLFSAPYYPETFSISRFMSGAAPIIIMITGTILCYRANRSGDNTDFIGRMICLNWPIGIRLLVLAAATGLAIYSLFSLTFKIGIAMGSLMEQIETALYAVAFVWQCALQILYYLLLYKYVRLVAQPKEAS